MRAVPINISHDELVGILEDILTRVRAGDSFEGHITWSLPVAEDAEPRSFDVITAYRIGNLQGQGGMRMLNGWQEDK